MKEKLGALAIASGMLFGGCSGSEPIIVKDCRFPDKPAVQQKNNFSQGHGETIGGITKSGNRDLIDITVGTDNSIAINAQTLRLQPAPLQETDTEIYQAFRDEDLIIEVTVHTDAKSPGVNVGVSCDETLP